MKTILFRADASAEIGTGHVMRCLAIARALSAHGAQCVFISACESTHTLVDASAFPCHILASNDSNIEHELPAFAALLNKIRPDWVVVDQYSATDSYLSTLRAYAPVAYLDDFAEQAYPVDLVINYNIFADASRYAKLYPEATRRLLGVDYAPLREEFLGAPRVFRERCENILLSTGGADSLHIGIRLLEAFLQAPRVRDLRAHILVGAFHADADAILQLAERSPSIVVHRQVTQMAELMCTCDLAVSAAGSTLYELCACGIPCVCYTFVDNQLMVAQGFSDAGLMQYGGDFRGNPEATIQAILERIAILRGDVSLRHELSERMRQTVDANGARRIADVLLGIRAPS